MKSFVSDLPAEIRLDIYERILRFDCPLKRIKPIDELDGTVDDELRQYVRGGRVNIAIIFASRTTYQEAIPVLYKLNTISLCHDDVCLLTRERGFTRCDAQLLQQIDVVDWLESGPWTPCAKCARNVLAFLEAFHTGYFPKLKTVTLDLERFRGGYAALGEQLLKAGVDVTFDFSAVGWFTLHNTKPMIELRFNTIAVTWAYYSALPPFHDELRRRCKIAEQFRGIDERFIKYVREILWNYYEYCHSKTPSRVLSEAQGMLRGVDRVEALARRR
ncbi:hypothetical protein LTR36_008708 [Oleoguttula mirabilis]|uniref:Uncharacterized protein n=1 Tax=Oleoguttula mirabilis TaxID=1507867 RepID=A0AAV9JTT3_9PEZI|nr:hypothetical protein LTR36_008708 [Oleoguttula mirabilis]